MKIKKLILIALSLICVATITTGVTLASFNSSLTTNNVVTFGNISVELIDIYEHQDNVRPGQIIDKVVSAKNDGNNTEYVRIYIEKNWTKGGEVLTDKDGKYIEIIPANPDLWIYGDDGYYYYQKPLEPNQTADNLMNSFTLKSDWDMEGYFKLEGNIIVRAEAVQYDNFIPERNSNGEIIGWWDIEIQEYNDGEVNVSSGNGENGQVVFTENAHKFVSLPSDDLFLNFKNVMPGDTVTQNISIKNDNSDTTDIYLYALQMDNSAYISAEEKEIADELMKLMTIELTAKNKDNSIYTIYNGPIYGEGNSYNMHKAENAILLGTFAKGDSLDITATLKISPELDNRYANAVAKIKWVFTATGEGETPIIPEPPIQTGESKKMVYILVAVVAVALLVIVVLSLLSKKKKNKDDE